ncbi:MAG: glycosyl transferase [Chthoniobacteraceae bacterium]|nr:glycosyl transferase [Chthoniobacteraceae bacterium]
MLKQITPLLLTFNEAPNLRRTLEQLKWASRIVVIDSGSTDETKAILNEFPSVQCLDRDFDSHAAQWNFGLEQIRSEWVLSLDADYVLSEALIKELDAMRPDPAVAAYFASFTFCVYGSPVRGNLYPPRAVLFRPDAAQYVQDGHTQHLEIDGASTHLRNLIFHDDRKPLLAWLIAQARYAALEADKLLSLNPAQLSAPDRVRRAIVPAPFLVFFYTLFAKGLIFDGWAGWWYVLQRTVAELILSLYLLERRWNQSQSNGADRGLQ